MKEYFIKNDQNNNLNVIEPEYNNKDNYLAVAIHIHGISSSFQKFIKYPELLDSLHKKNNYLTKIRIKSYFLEFHGHGKSEGLRCLINDFDDLLEDLDCIVNHVREKHSNQKLKFILIAESMGGAVAIKYNIRNPNIFDGNILLAPMCGIHDSLKPGFVKTQFLMSMSYLFPDAQWIDTASDIPFKSNLLPIYEKIHTEDKYYYKDNYRLATARECLYASDWLGYNSYSFNKPFLLIHGLDDTVTVPEKSIEFYRNASTDEDKKNIILIEKVGHGLLAKRNQNDRSPEIIMDHIINWINKIIF